jgi:2-polyprenyl-3-methyl-5-hydroxy-6-metoxy-1,4-benzoquinol methylase
MTLPFQKLPGLHADSMTLAAERMSHLSEEIGPFPDSAIRRKWTAAGLAHPLEIPRGFDKVLFLMQLLSSETSLKGRSVIDFGCGLSAFVAQAARLGMNGVGIDTFEEHGGHCHALASLLIDTLCEPGRRPTLVRADILRDQVPGGGSFDFATSMGMMEHIFGVAMRKAIITKMMEALRPGGWLILICGPNQRFPIDLFHYGPRLPCLHQLPVPLRRIYLATFAGDRNKNPRWLSGMSVRELEASMYSAGAASVYSLFPMWARLVRNPRLTKLRLAYVAAADALSYLNAEPVIVLAAQKQ